MTTLFTKTLLTTGLVLTTATAALAHSNEARQMEQAYAIEDGRRDGSITWREGRLLRKDQIEISRVKSALEDDGRLSNSDKRVLYKMQDEAEARIAAEANDTWHRPWWLPRFAR
jgi:hypothetical protein